MADLVRHVLEAEGFTTMHNATAESAWNEMMSHQPDAAIIDISLDTSQSGWDLIEQARGTEWLRDLPIVVFTGQPPEIVRDRAAMLGCEYLEKPFTAAALLDRLNGAIRRAGKAPATRPVAVVILAGSYRIEGTVHLQSGVTRFSDAWDAAFRDARAHIPIADARLYSMEAEAQIASTPTLLLRKEQVTAIFEA